MCCLVMLIEQEQFHWGLAIKKKVICIHKASQFSYCSWQDPRAMFRHSQVVQVNFDI